MKNKTSKLYLLYVFLRASAALIPAHYDATHNRPFAIMWVGLSILSVLFPILSYVHDNNELLIDIKEKLNDK